MRKHWPNFLKDKDDDTFWAHEWDKHGVKYAAIAYNWDIYKFSEDTELRNQ